MAQEDEADPVLAAIVHEAMRFLVETDRVPIADLAEQLKPVPGLYAVFGTDDAWKDHRAHF